MSHLDHAENARHVTEVICPTPGCGVTMSRESVKSSHGFDILERIHSPFPCSVCLVDRAEEHMLKIDIDDDDPDLNRGHASPPPRESRLFRGVVALLRGWDRLACKVEHAYYRRRGGRLKCSRGHLIQDLVIESCHTEQGRATR